MTLEIETARLKMRPFAFDDLDDYYRQILSDPEVMKTLLAGRALSWEEAQARLTYFIKHWQLHHFGLWVIVDKQGDLLGQCGLQFLDNTSEIELAYAIAKSHWNRGIATEAAKAVLTYGFATLKLSKIVAITAPTNLASQRVMTKVGLKYEKDAYLYQRHVVYYALLRKVWQSDVS